MSRSAFEDDPDVSNMVFEGSPVIFRTEVVKSAGAAVVAPVVSQEVGRTLDPHLVDPDLVLGDEGPIL